MVLSSNQVIVLNMFFFLFILAQLDDKTFAVDAREQLMPPLAL